MPYKLKDPYRHKFNKAQYHLSNWPAYDQALKSRGKITFWFTEDVIEKWYYKKPKKKSKGRQNTYSDFAIFIMRVIGTIYKQRLRQTEGLVESIVALMKLNLEIPDHTTLSRRMEDLAIPDLGAMLEPDAIVNAIVDSTGLKIFGTGEWQDCKYQLKQRKEWRKLHIVINRETGTILSSELTTNHVGDPTPVPELLDRINQNIASLSGDTAYDVEPVYLSVANKNATAIIAPRANAVVTENCIETIPNRALNINDINEYGKQRWQKFSGYNWRSLVETTMSRYKKIIGSRVYSKKLSHQQKEATIGCYVLNKMLELGMPDTFKIRASN